MNSYELKPIKDATKELDSCSYEYVSCCYAGGDGQKRSVYHRRLKTMERSDALKYFAILKDSLKGTLNKNIFVTALSEEQKQEGGLKAILRTAVREPLREENMVELFDRLLASVRFASETNYFITAANNTIDIRPRTSDRIAIDDASEFSFSYLVVSVCPAKLSDPGLAYDEASGEFRTRITDWVAGGPLLSVVYPVPAGNGADLDHALVFSKAKDYETAADFMGRFFGDENPPEPSDQVFEGLAEIVQNTFDAHSDPERIEILDEELKQFKKDYRLDHETGSVFCPDPAAEAAGGAMVQRSLAPEPVITKQELSEVLRRTGATAEELQNFEAQYDSRIGEKDLPLYGVKPLAKKLGQASVVIKTENPSALERRSIDGEEYLLVPLAGGVKLNDEVL